ncbi:MAG: glutamate-ammonia-ligase adenylyltransferase [Spirochaetes bacterium]|nr:MAG: glutamate-ammonia-ligase adenylyltransferase [Spirochaetota bacterium]
MESRPSFDSLRSALSGIDPGFAEWYLGAFSDSYYSSFGEPEITRHCATLAGLSAGTPVFLDAREDSLGISMTVIGYDHPGVLSMITGVLSAMGFQTVSGRIFSSSRAAPLPSGRRVIIDRFRGALAGAIYSPLWIADVRRHVAGFFALLERGDDESAVRARRYVNELVADSLPSRLGAPEIFYPISVEMFPIQAPSTLMRVTGQDTPYFLYALTGALGLQGIEIEEVVIETSEGEATDEITFVDTAGGSVIGTRKQDEITFTTLLAKQFTYFLAAAPDPFEALVRFELLLADITGLPGREDWRALIADPRFMKDLAKLLGASTFLWEDVVRLQYETVLPLLGGGPDRAFACPLGQIDSRLAEVMDGRRDYAEKIAALNEFKDREIFLIDLDHLLNAGRDFRSFAEHLTELAEAVIRAAVGAAFRELAALYGDPRTVAGLEAQYAVMALGKMGGAALGYASDLELMIVYSDAGETNGGTPVPNTEYFERMVQMLVAAVRAKREGIFEIDLRLRPYGGDGPLAVSLDAFCRYYGLRGDARSWERLSLVRMRCIGGDRSFGARLERLRDEFIYGGGSIDIGEIHRLRERQFKELAGLRPNAKYTPGALADLEYAVQLLQVRFGWQNPALRTPRIHSALAGLARCGVLTADEGDEIGEAYDFLRRLINGLRMLRGNARDLFLPAPGSLEYGHVARRMGYGFADGLSAAQQLHVDFDTHTALVRAFITRHFGTEGLLISGEGTIADLVVAGSDSPGIDAVAVLARYGFQNSKRAMENLKRLSGRAGDRGRFTRLSVLAADFMRQSADPDMALNNWERFTEAIGDPAAHFRSMSSQPRKLELLAGIFAASQFLADILIGNPDFLDWTLDPNNLYRPLSKDALVRELSGGPGSRGIDDEWRARIRRVKRREILRIGTRDICLGMPLDDIVSDLSILADAFVEASVARSARLPGWALRSDYSVIALGKLGGAELNYSSDIDLLLVVDREGEAAEEAALMERLIDDLSRQTGDGYAYRVDIRLRPHGSAGPMASGIGALEEYYGRIASLWELQALIKARSVAGNERAGRAFVDRVRPIVAARRRGEEIAQSIARMRDLAELGQNRGLSHGFDVKNGIGGIRDIEFAVQGLQLAALWEYPELYQGNTRKALALLRDRGLISAGEAGQLDEGYTLLRSIEHCLQLFEDRQVHALPLDAAELSGLARRVSRGGESATVFLDRVEKCSRGIRDIYNRTLHRISEDRLGASI